MGLMVEDQDDDGNLMMIFLVKCEGDEVKGIKEFVVFYVDIVLMLLKFKEQMKNFFEKLKQMGYQGKFFFVEIVCIVGEVCWVVQKVEFNYWVVWKVVLNFKDYFCIFCWVDNIYVLGMDEDWQCGIVIKSQDKIEFEDYQFVVSSNSDGDGFFDDGDDLNLDGSDIDIFDDDDDFFEDFGF